MNNELKKHILNKTSNRYKTKLNIPDKPNILFTFEGDNTEHDYLHTDYYKGKTIIYYNDITKLLVINVTFSGLTDLLEVLNQIDISSLYCLCFHVSCEEKIDITFPKDTFNFMSKAKNLVYLSVDNLSKENEVLVNDFANRLSSFGFTESLTDLNISNSNLSEIPKCLEEFKNLTHLNLSGNNIKDIYNIDYKNNLKKLKVVNVSKNQISLINLDLFDDNLVDFKANGNLEGNFIFTENKPNIKSISISSSTEGKKYTANKKTIINLYDMFQKDYMPIPKCCRHNSVNLHLRLNIIKEIPSNILNLKYHDLKAFTRYICKNKIALREALQAKITLGIDIEESKKALKSIR